MRIEPKLKTKVIITLLLVGIIINGLSLLLFNALADIIHGTLYYYGLRSSLDWLLPIWNDSNFFTYTLILSIIFFGFSVPLLISYTKNRYKIAKLMCYLLLIAGVAVGFLSIYFFSNIDSIVNGTLYNYGLQFNNEWAQAYWIYARPIVIFISVSSSLALISVLLILVGSRRSVEITGIKLISPILVVVAVIALSCSIILTNSILAFIGIGLIFWGLIFVYVRTEDYVKRTILNTTISSQKSTIDQILRQLSFVGKPVYLPPKFFNDSETSKAYIPKNYESPLPTLEVIQQQESQLFITSPSGILLTPSGAGLVKLFEEVLETNFTNVDLRYLQQKLPPLLIENLEIAQNFEMQIENKKVRIEITNSIYNSSSNVGENQKKTEYENENPIISAIACSLAKSIGQPVRLEKIQIGTNDRDFTVEFSILDDEVTNN